MNNPLSSVFFVFVVLLVWMIVMFLTPIIWVKDRILEWLDGR